MSFVRRRLIVPLKRALTLIAARRANPNKVWYAPSLAGPWQGGTDIAPEAEKTYGSQNTFELTIAGSKVTTYIYMGDAWDSTGGVSSNYMWLPMTVDTSAHTVTLDYYSAWTINVATGVVAAATTKKWYEAEDADISGKAGELPALESIYPLLDFLLR
jgi:hypothetical protein